MDAIRSKLQEIQEQYNGITAKLMDEEILRNPVEVARLSKEQARLEQSVDAWRKLQALDERIEEAESLVNESDP
ncbi:MAG: PCRF domain-containing protein, partial [Solobacterium sp.]|nr:PCRF domain-containing protein [Solobacterium sp.]